MSPHQASKSVVAALERCFKAVAPVAPGETVLVAFSGGSDSTALVSALVDLAASNEAEAGRDFQIVAAHLDHGLDRDSERRAGQARVIADALGVRFIEDRQAVDELRRRGESLEAAARRIRYRFLERVRREVGAHWILTAHHRTDQAETVIMRLLSGSGLAGLGGIKPRWGRVVRPLLDLDPSVLHASLRSSVLPGRLEPVEDPTNADRAMLRNRIRHELLPHLEGLEPNLVERLGRLAAATHRSRTRWQALLHQELEPIAGQERATGSGAHIRDASVSMTAFAGLPHVLREPALDLLHQIAGLHTPASQAARYELDRQIDRQASDPTSATKIACDCGHGWHWRSNGERLILEQKAPGGQNSGGIEPFLYTLEAQGRIEVAELGVRVRLDRSPIEPWMTEGSQNRVALAGPPAPNWRLEIRNRRPGDRLRPLGAPGSRRLKELLIDRRVPRQERDRIPLAVIDGKIAWVPGITIDEAFRLTDETEAWVLQIEPMHPDRADSVRSCRMKTTKDSDDDR